MLKIDISTTIFSKYNDLPYNATTQDKLNKLKEVYDLAFSAIKTEHASAELKFETERAERRNNAQWKYYFIEPIVNEHGIHYHMVQEAINPLEGDTDFYKTKTYQSFKIVNNVFIATGGGYVFPIVSGHILTDEDVINITHGTVPEVLKRKK